MAVDCLYEYYSTGCFFAVLRSTKTFTRYLLSSIQYIILPVDHNGCGLSVRVLQHWLLFCRASKYKHAYSVVMVELYTVLPHSRSLTQDDFSKFELM